MAAKSARAKTVGKKGKRGMARSHFSRRTRWQKSRNQWSEEKELEEDQGEAVSEEELEEQPSRAPPKNPLPINAFRAQSPVQIGNPLENSHPPSKNSNDAPSGSGPVSNHRQNYMGRGDGQNPIIVSDVEEDSHRDAHSLAEGNSPG